MPSPLSPTALICAAATYAGGISHLRALARHHRVPLARLQRELAGIGHGDLESFDNWLDSVPGRRAVLTAISEAAEHDDQKFMDELDQDYELSRKFVEESLARNQEQDQKLMEELAAEDPKLDALLRDLRHG